MGLESIPLGFWRLESEAAFPLGFCAQHPGAWGALVWTWEGVWAECEGVRVCDGVYGVV